MFGLGKLLALPVKILNVPARALEKTVAAMSGDDDIPKSDRIISKPLEKLAEAIEEIDQENSNG